LESLTHRQLFLRHLAQTSDAPLGLEIIRAEGMYLWDVDGKKYLDMIAGIGVCHIGHGHPAVLDAVRDQLGRYMHLLVYGELIQSPQLSYARMLAELLPGNLQVIYFTNSGAEAAEGALKLAKRFTGRPEIGAFNQGYHGSTHGALSVMGNEYWRNAYRPLLPGIRHLEYNSGEGVQMINSRMACVIGETVQAEAGVIVPDKAWWQSVRSKCDETGTLLILDEVQCGFGRNGTLWAFEQFGIVPDILLLGKALGGGMPLGAFIADQRIMSSLSNNPELGHMTTFGGHPVCCAAGKAALSILLQEDHISRVSSLGKLFSRLLIHPRIIAVRALGLMIAVEFDSPAVNREVIKLCISRGVLVDWFLFSPQSLRLAPPLIITEEQVRTACQVILESADRV